LDIIWSDNFDSYTNGQLLDGGADDGGWKGWDNDPAYGAFVTNVQSHSTANSVNVTGSSDLVHEYGYSAKINYTFIAWQFIPNDFQGETAFIILSDYEDGAGQGNIWAVQLAFNSETNEVNSQYDAETLPLIKGRWVQLRMEINLSSDKLEMYYDNELLKAKNWSDGPNNQGGGPLVIDAIDLFANGASDVYYDDISIVGAALPPPKPELKVDTIAGGFGVSAVVNNIGEADATNVAWTIALDGGLIIVGKETTGDIATLAAAANSPIKSGLILGFGKTTITVTATCDEDVSDTATASGFVFLVFVLGVA